MHTECTAFIENCHSPQRRWRLQHSSHYMFGLSPSLSPSIMRLCIILQIIECPALYCAYLYIYICLRVISCRIRVQVYNIIMYNSIIIRDYAWKSSLKRLDEYVRRALTISGRPSDLYSRYTYLYVWSILDNRHQSIGIYALANSAYTSTP